MTKSSMKISLLERLRDELPSIDPIQIAYSIESGDIPSGCVVLGGRAEIANIQAIVLPTGTSLSLAQFVVDASEETVAQWRTAFPSLGDIKLCSHSLGFDNALAFVLLYLRCQGVNLSKDNQVTPWTQLSNNAKKGRFDLVGEPSQSIFWLINSWGHGYLTSESGQIDQHRFATGFLKIVEFVIEGIHAEANPANVITSLNDSYLLQEALVFHKLAMERYQKVVASGEAIQLAFPVQGGCSRLMVDALVASEKRPLGDIRAFALTDRVNPFRKNGFSVIASYQELAAGTPYGYSVSVIDTRLGISLEALAETLNLLEVQASKDEAPARWVIEYDGSLLRPAKASNPSKLDWNQVVGAIWIACNPMVSIDAFNWDATESRLATEERDICSLQRHERSGKSFAAGRWARKNTHEYLSYCPTFDRILVSLISEKKHSRIPSLQDIPPAISFERLVIPGGIALIHANGVVLLDDWTKDMVDFDQYFHEFENIARRYEEIITFTERFRLIELTRMLSDTAAETNDSEFDRWIETIARVKLELSQLHAETLSQPVSFHAQLFRSAIEQAWGVGEQLNELTQAADQMHSAGEMLFKLRHERASFKWQRFMRSIGTALLVVVPVGQLLTTVQLPNVCKFGIVLTLGVGVGTIVWIVNKSRHRQFGTAPNVDGLEKLLGG